MKKNILLIVLILLLAFGISGLYMGIKEYSDGEVEYSELEQYVSIETRDKEVQTSDNRENKSVSLAPNEVTVDFSGLKKVNSDFIAWILIPGTNINYPVVNGIDNSYYVTHTFRRKLNKSGAIFTDMRNSLDFSDKNTIIYGHNLKNSKMFSDLRKFSDKKYFDKHKKIIIYTENKKLIYEAFAVYKTMEDSDTYKVKFLTDEDFSNHIDTVISNSVINFSGSKEEIQRVITLSTCTNNLEGERVVVVARFLEEINEVEDAKE